MADFIPETAEDQVDDHVWAFDRLAGFLAGGLTTAERLRTQRHLAGCDECRRVVAGLEAMDARIRRLFAGFQPPATLEDRTVNALRTTSAKPANRRRAAWTWPMKGMLVAAGVMLLVGVGAMLAQQLEMAGVPLMGMLVDDSKSMSVSDEARRDSLQTIYANLSSAGLPVAEDSNGRANWREKLEPRMESEFEMVKREPAPGQIKHKLGVNNVISGVAPGGQLTPQSGGVTYSYVAGNPNGDVKDSPPPTGVPATSGFGNKLLVEPSDRKVAGSFFGRSGATASPEGESKSQWGMKKAEVTSSTATLNMPALPVVAPLSSAPVAMPTPAPDFGYGVPPAVAAPPPTMSPPPPPGGDVYFRPGESAPTSSAKDKELTAERDRKFSEERKGNLLTRNQELETTIGSLEQKKAKNPVEEAATDQQNAEKAIVAQADKSDNPDKAPALPQVRRIIIRSGDIEFEVDSFDAAVAGIFRIISKTKDAFVATVNSDKLANGKMKGSVVVRMPPERLDDFVLELRQTLGKNGELKGQRIGSEDVTKRYTDLESELKAHRTMETRLLQIMKEAKGTMKDLLAVEKDLGVYREKIEKIEGELRYYANLAAMSTLTITLQEKEIRAAAAFTETEQVKTGIEVEDVEKAYQDAQAAIRELKGRIGRAEMKQQGAGQFAATLVFELPPDQAGAMRDRLRQLGNMVRLDIERVQKMDNGGLPTTDAKIRRGDTEFHVALYNLANVEPRETTTMTLVVADVPAVYRKIRATLAGLKMQTRNANLQENDKTDVVGNLDFNIRRADEPTVQQALDAAGEIVKRTVSRRADATNVTDSKIGFSVRIVSTATIEPRESIRRLIAVADVGVAFHRLEAALAAKELRGHVRNAVLDEARRQDASATLDFDISRADEPAIRKLLDDLGEGLGSKSDRKTGDNFTDAKVLYSIGFIPEATVEARDLVKATVAAVDVQDAYQKLRTQIAGLKGLVRSGTVQETDRRNITAHLDVVVAKADEPAVQASLADLGEILSRSNERLPDGERVTATKTAFRIDLVSANMIEPRKSIEIDVEVDKVKERVAELSAAVLKAGGRIFDGPLIGTQKNGKIGGLVKFDVPLTATDGILLQIESANSGRRPPEEKVNEDSKAPAGRLAIARIEVRLHTADLLVPNDEGIGPQLWWGLSWSLRGLLISMSWLVGAIVFVGPWLLLIVGIVWLTMRAFRKPPAAETETVPASAPPGS
jgi:Domain of unknown function (DUF4349)/Putative zinc-finger